MDSSKNNTRLIKAEALKLGFSGCGIAQACFLPDEEMHHKAWIEKGFHADMEYMAENAAKRSDPRLLVDNAKSIVSVILNYYPHELQSTDAPLISKYAYGKDYHFVIKEKLNTLLDFINNNICKTQGRAFVDSAPLFEKAWAARAGLGWVGKHSILLTREFGSWVFIGEIILDMELVYDKPIENLCGSCTRCIDSCPTKAITEFATIDCNKCIAYHTIEAKSDFPLALKGKMNNYIFGCDICQNVCPWNSRPVLTTEKDFLEVNPLLKLSSEEIKKLGDAELKNYIKGTAIERTKVKRIRRNFNFISE